VYDTGTGQMRLYVNGVLQSTTVPTGNWSATGAFVAGRAKWAGAGTNFWSGGLDDVRVYQKVLTGDQIATLASDENPGRLVRVHRAALAQGTKSTLDGETATSLVYHVPLTKAAGGPYDLDYAAANTWGQRDLPTDATAVFEPEDTPAVNSATPTTPGTTGYPYATVHYLNADGREVNTATPGGHIDTAEYDKFGNVVRRLEASNRDLALGTLPGASGFLARLGLSSSDTASRAMALSTINTYATDGIDLIDSLGPTVPMVITDGAADPDGSGPLPALPAGATVVGRSHTVDTYDQNKPDGATYHLQTTEKVGGAVTGYPDVDVRTTLTGYAAEKGGTSGWQLKQPTSTVVDPSGANLATYVVYDASGRTTATWGIGATGSDARTTLTTYYTAGPNSADAACGNKPEWAGQPCVSGAAGPITGQRADMGSDLPVRRVDGYDRYGGVTHITETAGGKTRQTSTLTDAAGRVYTSQITADDGVAMPAVVTTYDPATGQVATTTMGDAVVSREYDQLGRQVTYSDADGGVTHYEFDHYGKPVRISDNTGSQTLNYDRSLEPRGLLTSIVDSVAGTFTAAYSPDGQLTTVTYPGGLTRHDVLDAAFATVQRVYTRDSDGQVIYAQSVVDNSHGQRVQDVYTGGSRTYGYDRQGRLTSAQELDGTGACTTRQYSYDGRTNRTAKSTFNPAADGSCRSDTADVSESHSYDSADRITDAGYTYDAFGRTTATPAGLINTYYVDDLVASQQLDDQLKNWTAYPDLRQRTETTQSLVNGAWTTTTSTLNHYGDDTDRPRWIIEDTTSGALTRNVSGPDGDLVATTSATGDVALQLTDLHGNVAATIDTGITTPQVEVYDEFGVASPQQSQVRYGWLGGKQRSSDALGGVVLMGVRLYNPSLGRFLQTDPVAGGSATAYDYCYGDPINCSDLDGRWPHWLSSVGHAVATGASFVYNHASDIGTGLGIVACFLPPPADLIVGGVAVGFSLLGAVKDISEGNYMQAAIGIVGAIPGVGAIAKGVKAYKAGKAALKAAERIGEYVPKYGSKADKLKNLVRPFRKLRSAAKKAEKELKPWEKVHRAVTGFETFRLGCKYWGSCRERAPFGEYWL
jgi:RHS repeat-associated protein